MGKPAKVNKPARPKLLGTSATTGYRKATGAIRAAKAKAKAAAARQGRAHSAHAASASASAARQGTVTITPVPSGPQYMGKRTKRKSKGT